MLVGPDIAGTGAGGWMKEFLNECGHVIDATTFHQYYGLEGLSHVHDYVDPKVLDMYELQLSDYISNVKSSAWADRLKMWNGETSSTASPPGKTGLERTPYQVPFNRGPISISFSD